jgi:hypothetical protein
MGNSLSISVCRSLLAITEQKIHAVILTASNSVAIRGFSKKMCVFTHKNIQLIVFSNGGVNVYCGDKR